MLPLLVFLFLLSASGGTLHAENLPANEDPADAVFKTPQTFEIVGHRITQKGLPYRVLKSLSDTFLEAVGAESPDLRASLVWLNKRPDQHLLLTTGQGTHHIPVSRHGAFDLPILPAETAAVSRIQAEDGLSLGVRPALLVKLPLAQSLDLQTVRHLLAQGNAIRRHFPWYIKIAQFGRSNVDYAGMRLCFSTTTAGILIDGRRLEPDADGCVKLMVGNLGERTDCTVTFDSPVLFAELLLNSKT